MNNSHNKPRLSDNELREKVARLRKMKTVWRWVAGILLGLCILSFVFLFVSPFIPGKFADEDLWIPIYSIFGSFVIWFIFYMIYLSSENKIRVVVTESLLPDLLREKFTHVTYDSKGSVNRQLVQNIDMVDKGTSWSIYPNIIKGRNHFIGLYKGRKVEFSDITVFVRGKYATTAIFKGPWMTFDIGTPVPTRVKIQERSGDFAKGKRATSNVVTPNELFNARFKVSSYNPQLTYVLLTPRFIERIMKLGGRVRMCFEPGRAHVAFNTCRRPTLFKKKDGYDTFEVTGEEREMADLDGLRAEFRREIQYLTEVIDIICEGDGLVG